jgi:RNA polymerase subunit RPABC4/transcription elongation factor Spt4
MAKKKACKKCKLFVEGDTCPNCGSNAFTTSWQGRIFVSDVNKSEIGKQVNIEVKGEYAIKVR